ncbi:hypothetical protein FANTH_13975 [Fusarium anthophilum]|uniref:Xylanolytic transcriptional activator regulatory domain-containing protein n=1 Tax=Fusarium anthophilum TaxID=48485 RepID=A0A8H4YLH2_9HYPO|nr:hypothetical protein FANTH_13975 [Fusarium anthophilum]
MEELAERSALDSSTGISTQNSPEISHVGMDALGNLQGPIARGPVRSRIPTVSRSYDTTSSLFSSATHDTNMDLAGDLGLAAKLYKLFPSQSDVSAILKATVGSITTTFKSTDSTGQAAFAAGHLHAAALPKIQHPLPSVRASILRTMEEIVDGVDNFICGNGVVSTLEGLECLLLLGYWQKNAGNLRKAWLIFRQALSVGQLMGINTATVAPRSSSFSNQYPPSPDMLWFRSVACDRYLSLLLGLPPGTHDNSFAGQPQTARDTPSEKLDKLHAVISEKMIERNNSTQAEAYRLTQLISSDLLTGQGLMGDAWWELPLVNTEQSQSSTFEVAGGMILQMSHHLLLVLLHIPYMLRNPSFPHDQQSSVKMCTSSSRNILKRFRVFRSFNDSAYACRHVDYAALIAAITLLVSHAQYLEDRDSTNDEYLHRSADKILITTVRDRMKKLAYLNSDKFFEESRMSSIDCSLC